MESLYYELKPFGVKMAAMIPGGNQHQFQTPINILDGYEEPAARQREYLLDGNVAFPGPERSGGGSMDCGKRRQGSDQLSDG